ncbi:MAG TPA: FkbM family methyltransferase [Pedobacter sp.]|jgi:FkbM family methyltransferase
MEKIATRPYFYRFLKKLSFFNFFRDEEYQFRIHDFLTAEKYSLTETSENLLIEKEGKTIYLRKSASDVEVAEQILFKQEYLPLIDLIKINNLSVSNLVDAGANIGLATLFINSHFPNLKCICIEPGRDNYTLLLKNLEASDTNAICKNAALWHKNEFLALDHNFRDGKEWSLTVNDHTDAKKDIQGITLNQLIVEHDLETIDILKIDIEGAERYILNKDLNDLTFLNRTKVIAIEIHDEFDIRESIYETLRTHNFVLSTISELTFGVNYNLIK